MIRKSKEGEITLKKLSSEKVKKKKEETKNDSYVTVNLILLHKKSCISILYIEK